MDIRALAETFAAHMLNGVLAGVGLVLAAELGLRVLRHKGSATRFVIWFTTLAAVVLLPIMRLSDPTGSGRSPASGLVLSSEWAWGFVGAWALTASIGLIRLGFGLARLRTIRQRCETVASRLLDSKLAAQLSAFGEKRRVELCTSDEISTPTAIGLFCPAVVIPHWAMAELSAEELKTVVLHELAHLQRWDDWTNLLQQTCKALFFFHPAVWWIESKLTLEREMACDDFVLARTGNPHAYAECLVHLAERNFLQRSLALAQAAVGRVRHTSLRVMQILSKNRVASGPRNWIPAAGFAALLVVAGGGLAPHSPSLVTFSDVQPAAAVAASSDLTIDHGWLVPAKATQESIAKLMPKRVIAGQAKPGRATPLAQMAAKQRPTEVRLTLMPVQAVQSVPTVFVVMQEQQFGGVTLITWKFSVVEVVFHPAPMQVKAQNPARAI